MNSRHPAPPSLLLRLLDFVFLTRPILFFPGWATLLAGYMTARGLTGDAAYFRPIWWDGPLAAGMGAFALVMGATFVLNQLCDIDSDRRNNKLFLLGEGMISERQGYAETVLLLAAGLTIGWALNMPFLAALVVFAVLTGWAYNYPPLTLKSRPLGGLIANMGMGWLAFVLGWLAGEGPSPALLWASLPYLAFNTALYLLTTMPDVEGDRSTGKITFPIRFGDRLTLWLHAALGGAALAGGIWQGDGLIMMVSAATFPLMVRAALQGRRAAVLVAVKYGIFFLSLGVAIKFPGFFGIMVAAFLLTRYYYRRRFNFDYPNFRGE